MAASSAPQHALDIPKHSCSHRILCLFPLGHILSTEIGASLMMLSVLHLFNDLLVFVLLQMLPLLISTH